MLQTGKTLGPLNNPPPPSPHNPPPFPPLEFPMRKKNHIYAYHVIYIIIFPLAFLWASSLCAMHLLRLGPTNILRIFGHSCNLIVSLQFIYNFFTKTFRHFSFYTIVSPLLKEIIGMYVIHMFVTMNIMSITKEKGLSTQTHSDSI